MNAQPCDIDDVQFFRGFAENLPFVDISKHASMCMLWYFEGYLTSSKDTTTVRPTSYSSGMTQIIQHATCVMTSIIHVDDLIYCFHKNPCLFRLWRKYFQRSSREHIISKLSEQLLAVNRLLLHDQLELQQLIHRSCLLGTILYRTMLWLRASKSPIKYCDKWQTHICYNQRDTLQTYGLWGQAPRL